MRTQAAAGWQEAVSSANVVFYDLPGNELHAEETLLQIRPVSTIESAA
jgi:hypothetical protein